MSSPALPPPFGWIRLDEVGSTNDEARRQVSLGTAADLLVVTAVSQTSGRGRRGRAWSSPVGNLHASVLITLDRGLAESAQIGFVAALALAEGLGELVPTADFRCKWPNDVLCNGKKIAGMLLETAGDGWLVLGLGVDVAQGLPPGEALYASIALAELGWSGDTATVLAAFCRRFGPWLGRWRGEGFAPVRAAWLEHARGLGEQAVVRLEAETLTGRFAGLDHDGALMLDQGETGVRRILAGDVFFPG
ncbi:MAG: biotin--[acetyl-CoA-carboxylase] ligase [Magnetospirillum sp.]|nr:MAG: biotin--[acetyl-CoA-carboxylase] ligase [Magnetospirillum sp.]